MVPLWSFLAIASVSFIVVAAGLSNDAAMDAARQNLTAHTTHLSSAISTQGGRRFRTNRLNPAPSAANVDLETVQAALDDAIQGSDTLAIALYLPVEGIQSMRRVAVRTASDSTLRHFPLTIVPPRDWFECQSLPSGELGELHLATATAIVHGDTRFVARAVVSLTDASERLSAIYRWGAILAVAFLLAAYILIQRFADRITGQIKSTKRCIDDLLSGRPTQTPHYAGPEFEELGASLRELAEFLASRPEPEERETSNTEIETLKQRLEERSRMLEEAFIEMQTLDRSKESFLSNLSHEMRTPLTSIMAAQEILAEFADEDPETRPEFLSIIRVESQRLLDLISELLDLAKIEARVLQLHFENVAMSPLVEEVASTVFAQPRDRKVALAVTKSNEMAQCECDRERIARVLRSLIVDAFQHSPDLGTVKVIVDQEDTWCRITIEDEGAFSQDRATAMFHHWEPGDDTQEATLLGHAIAEKLAKAHGGRLSQKPSEKGGTTVRIDLPIHRAAVDSVGMESRRSISQA